MRVECAKWGGKKNSIVIVYENLTKSTSLIIEISEHFVLLKTGLTRC